MNDEFQIQQTLNRYSQTASRGKWDDAVDTYLPDGVWEIPHLGMKLDGHTAIRGALMQFIGVMEYVLQTNTPALIEIHGDRASAQSAIRECGKFRGRDEGFEFFGFYVDSLVRSPKGWKFAKRIFELRGQHCFPALPMKQQWA